MPRKNKIQITQAKENVPSPNNRTENSSNMDCNQKHNRNGTIDKIKKMRRIESLELDTGYIVKSDQPLTTIDPNAPLSILNSNANQTSSF